jgi:hypothetical protein
VSEVTIPGMISDETIALLHDHVRYQQGRADAWSRYGDALALEMAGGRATELDLLIVVSRLLNTDMVFREALTAALDRQAQADAEDEPAELTAFERRRAESLGCLRVLIALVEAHPRLPAPYISQMSGYVEREGPYEDALDTMFDLAESLGVDVVLEPDGSHELKYKLTDTKYSYGPTYRLHLPPREKWEEAAQSRPQVVSRPARRTEASA